MKVFLSWSGDQSRELAEVLREWLPAVLQSVRPFFTPSDIEKGARWNKDIAQELEASSFGVFCLTKENLARPWLMFEAGALSKRLDTSRVCPVLFGVDSADLEGPLVQFQAAPFSEPEMRKLMKTLNSGLGEQRLDDGVLNAVFEMWWPKLNERVNRLMDKYAGLTKSTPASRTDRDILEEVLQLTRLNATATDRPSRSTGARIEPDALFHAFRKILDLIEQVESDESEPLLPFIADIFGPLNYIVQRGRFNPEIQREIEKVAKQIVEKLSSAA
jgi:hypothetical protein